SGSGPREKRIIDLEMQQAWLHYKLHQDAAAETIVQQLREHLLSPALSSSGLPSSGLMQDSQRQQFARLTANLAVRNATRLVAEGNRRAAIQVLNDASPQVGSDSVGRVRLATGYLTAGEPKASIAIYESVDMQDATVGDRRAAIGAAMETQQKNLAQEWLARALARYPHDAGLLLLAGEFAQSNGSLPLAQKYLHAALAADSNPEKNREIQDAAIAPRVRDLLASIESAYSGWLGATAYVNHVLGSSGTTQLTDLEIPVEASFFLGQRARLTAIARTVVLDSGAYFGTASQPLGTLVLHTPAASAPLTGVGGEVQLATRNFAGSIGVTPAGFPVANFTAAATLHMPPNPWTLSFSRDSIRESQLAYAGLHDPAAPVNTWGGVTENLGTVQYARGNAQSGWYATVSAGAVTGKHVRTNPEITGDAGAYWQLWSRPTRSLKIGVNFYGQHNARNELFYTYGHGGYFSPEYFLLPAVPLAFTGNRTRLQYEVAGSLGPQIYSEASAPWFPLDATLQNSRGNPVFAAHSTVTLNYGVHASAEYLLGEHWRTGAFFSVNNSDKYNQQVGGLSLHYLFTRQPSSSSVSRGAFPYSGLRPYLTP
ncbi:MAG: cellulose synthase subunit BcsC-related outer membrane protein, partial [Acidobacteriaceae bacterium]